MAGADVRGLLRERWPERARRLRDLLDSFAFGRAALPAVAAVSAAVYWIESLAEPLGGGRDYFHYLMAYVQLFDAHPLLPADLTFRAPLTPLLVGGLLEAGGVLAEVVMSLLFAAAVVAWFLVARRFGGVAAVVTAAAVLFLYPSYGLLFHELASDSLFAAGFAFWALLLAHATRRPSGARFLMVGLGIAVLVLLRPSNQVLLLAVLYPFVLPARWRDRGRWALAVLVAAAVPISAWAVQNGLRYGTYTVARGSGETLPLYRAFITDRIVSPSNGPASRELAQAVQRYLLTRRPYRDYGVTLKQFFSSGSARAHEDLAGLSDRIWGWDSDYAKLRSVGIEAVEAHPGTYVHGVLTTVWQELTRPRYIGAAPAPAAGRSAPPPMVRVHGRLLPSPGPGELIPSTSWPDTFFVPDHRLRVVWTSPTTRHIVFRKASDQRRYGQLVRRMDRLGAEIPWHGANLTLAHRIDQATHRLPPPVFWLVLGVVALALRRPSGMRLALALLCAAAVVVVVTAMAIPTEVEYAMPFVPVFILVAAAGLFGDRPAGRGPLPLLVRPRAPAAG
jgi:hypothetical protein